MVTLAQPNFSSGELTPLAHGRTDLTRYGTGLRTCRNWIIRPHGCVMNRQGTQFIAATKYSGAQKSRAIPFVFSSAQSYLCEFAAGAIRVYSNGTYTGVEVATPYTEADLPNLQYAQSADVLTVTLQRLPQYELRRTGTGPLAFTFTQVTYTDGPFLTQNTNAQIQVYASATTGTVTLVSTTAIFASSHVGGLFRLEQENVGDVAPWEPTKLIATGSNSPVGILRRNDGKTYKCVAATASTSNTATGTIPPTHDSGVVMDGDGNKIASFADVCGVSWLFMDAGFGIVRITGFTSSTQVTGTVVKNLPSTVVGGYATAHGPYTFSGDGVTQVFSPLTGNTSTDPTKYVVTIGGVIQDPATYTVTQPGGAITFVAAPAAGASNVVVTQVSANNRSSLWSFGAWSDNQGYPATVTYFQDRQFFAGTTAQPQGVWGSKTGQYTSFGTSVPSQDDDALTFFLNARQINAITDLIALESLLCATTSAVWRVTSGVDEVLTPSTVGFKPQNYIGASAVRSAIVGDSAIYPQTDGRRVRDLLFDFQFDKFTGNELSILAEHLFPYGTTITRLDYAQYPFSLVHAVRNDGVMPTLSYLRDQEVLGWSPYDTEGLFEDVCSIPENGITSTYVIVKRTVNGASVRYIERFANREFADIVDAFFVDAGITYDGRNSTSVTMALSGGALWDITENLTLNASSAAGWATFTTSDIGNEIWLSRTYLNTDGESVTDRVRLKIVARTSAVAVTVNAVSNVPASLQGTAVTTWTFAKKVISGLSHLQSETVSILADGMDVDPQDVSGGQVTLLHPGGVVHVGLGYESDLETLDFNVPGGETVRARSKTIPQANVLLYQSRGVFVGPDEDHLDEIAQRESENYDDPIEPLTDIASVPVRSRVSLSGRMFVRQSRPLPVTIIGLLPEVEFGD